jgi:hypothetical protein
LAAHLSKAQLGTRSVAAAPGRHLPTARNPYLPRRIVVRNSLTAKPGQAGKLVAQLKEVPIAGNLRNHRVLTDVIGEFNQVVMEHEVESVAEFEEALKKYITDPQVREKAKGYTELWVTGRRELFQVL